MSFTPLNALRVFEAVSQAGSFRGAAEVLCVTQSAVSHQIKHLENWLGAPLFEREGNRTRLLPHGAELARALTLSFAEIDAACERAKQNTQDQPLVIAAIPSVALCWLIPRLADFRVRNPTIETRIVYAMHGRDINFRDAHVAFVFAPDPPAIAGVETIHFLPGASVPVCSPQLLPNAGQHAPEPAELLKLGLLHDADTTGWKSWAARAGLQAPALSSGAMFEDFNLLRAAALSGQGVALCATAMIQPDLDDGRLVQLSDIPVLEEYAYYLLVGPLAQADMGDRANAFKDWVLEVCAPEKDSLNLLP